MSSNNILGLALTAAVATFAVLGAKYAWDRWVMAPATAASA